MESVKGLSAQQAEVNFMPEPIASSESTDSLPAASESTGEELGLAQDYYADPDAETPDEATGAEDGLSQESDQADGKEDVAATPEPGPETATGTPAEPTQSFYKYGDSEFKSPEDVSNFIKSIEGRQRVTQAAHADTMQKNAAWINWSKDPAKVREHLAELEGIKPEEIKLTDEKKTFLSDTDWQNLTAMVDKGEGKQALATMAHYFDQVMDSRLGAIEAKMQASVQPMQDAQAAKEATVSLFRQAENTMDNQGALVWPEFNKNSDQYDPQFCQVFAQVWQQLPASVAWDNELYGVEVAYNRTKQFLASQETAAPPAESPANAAANPASERAQTAARNAQGQFVKQTEETATAVGGSGADPPPSTGPADSYSEAAIIRGMDNANKDRDEVFGIRR